MISYSVNILVLSLCILHSNCQPIPIKLNLEDKSTGNLDFALSLPNNDTVQIGLSFRLLTYSNTTSSHRDVESDNEDEYISTTTSKLNTKFDKKKFVTVEEAIEGFRQDLIKKEIQIAGIIESKDIFYRHFKLEFDDDTMLTIRCTYDSNYAARSLKISCYEYHELQTERMLRNGEVKLVKHVDPNYKTDVELVNLKGMKQIYKMDVS